MRRVSSSRKSVLRPSSPTLPSESVCVCSSLKTARRSLLSCPYVLSLSTILRPVSNHLISVIINAVILRTQNDGCLNFVDENDEVLISGFGRRGKAKGDIPGVRFKVVKVSGVGLLALWKEKKVRLLPSFPWRPPIFPAAHTFHPLPDHRKSPVHKSPPVVPPFALSLFHPFSSFVLVYEFHAMPVFRSYACFPSNKNALSIADHLA